VCCPTKEERVMRNVLVFVCDFNGKWLRNSMRFHVYLLKGVEGRVV